MSTINSRLYPTIQSAEVDVLNFYKTLTTGLAGTLVKIVTGSVNPQNSMGFSSQPVGANFNQAGTYIFDNRYQVNWAVTPTVSGDTAYNAIGITQWSTLEYDNNGNPLKYNNRRAHEIGAVRSGEAVPILTKATVMGIWGKYIDQSTSNVQPGNVLCVSRSGDGRLASVDPTNAAVFNTGSSSWIYTPAHVVGKILTSLPASNNTGIANSFSAEGGYVLFSFDPVA